MAGKELCVVGLGFFCLVGFFTLNMDVNTVTCYRSGTSSYGLSVGFLQAACGGCSKAILLPRESMYLPSCAFTKYLNKG